VLKEAEGSSDIILRAYETNGSATRATIRMPEWKREVEANFGPCEIKTFRIPKDPAQPVVETDLLERELVCASL
jgi:alpha-mannosidase